MFSYVAILALLTVASAQYLHHPYRHAYGVNPIVNQYAVPTIAKHVMPHHYAAGIHTPGVEYDRDFQIEQIGEKYAYQHGPASLQYSFVRGVDHSPVAHYGVPHQYAGIYGAHVQPYAHKLRAVAPVVAKKYVY